MLTPPVSCSLPPRLHLAVLLNILIAVVGDSHEHATIDAQLIFLRNRIQQAAQVDAGDADSWAWRLVDCLLRPLLRPVLIVEKADLEGDNNEMWMGRALELEQRTRGIIVEEGGQTREQVGALREQVGALGQRMGRIEQRIDERMGELERNVKEQMNMKEQMKQQLAEITRMLSERQGGAVAATPTPAQAEEGGETSSRKERARRDTARKRAGRSPDRARPLSPRWWARPQS